MAQFTRATIIAVTDILDRCSQAEFHRFVLGVGMEEIANLGSVRSKCNTVVSYLLKNPEAKTQYGENLTDEVVRQVTSEAIGNCSRYSLGSREFDYVRFQEQYGELNRAILRDGFTAEGGELRRGLPHEVDLPTADDEVHKLLKEFGFTTALGHLDQGISSHARGDYASANAMFRSCLESLLDEAARKLARGSSVPESHADRRQWLASQSFFDVGLNEWDPVNRSKGFVEALYRRLCPEGSHPGLSDEDDSTFRLHLVLLNARVFLRRLRRMLP
ncbi:MAG: hypothetical protein K1X57_22770 [Gemmataceae bacterium]|nr:hypothetical protein [Gemmataceae bacterium]